MVGIIRRYFGKCTLFNIPGQNYAGGNVIGFSNADSADACCSSCGAKATCEFYNFRSSDAGCTLYSTATGAKTTVAGDACGSKKPPPPPPAPLPTHPDDSPCVKWIPFTMHTPISSADAFVTSILTTVLGACTPSCYCASTIGNVLPCFASDPGIDVFGHHDWLPGSNLPGLCIAAKNDRTIFGHNQFMAGKGPEWEKFQWKVTQQGATVPSNAIRAGNRALGRSTQNVPNPGCGHGYTGWIDINDDGTLGPLQCVVACTLGAFRLHDGILPHDRCVAAASLTLMCTLLATGMPLHLARRTRLVLSRSPFATHARSARRSTTPLFTLGQGVPTAPSRSTRRHHRRRCPPTPVPTPPNTHCLCVCARAYIMIYIYITRSRYSVRSYNSGHEPCGRDDRARLGPIDLAHLVELQIFRLFRLGQRV